MASKRMRSRRPPPEFPEIPTNGQMPLDFLPRQDKQALLRIFENDRAGCQDLGRGGRDRGAALAIAGAMIVAVAILPAGAIGTM